MAEVIILGSSAATPFPRTLSNQWSDYSNIEHYTENFPLHHDPICKNAKRGGKDKRTRSAIAIRTEKGAVLFDAGPDIYYQMEKYGIKPTAVFINHEHRDAAENAENLKRIGVKIYSEKDGTVSPEMTIAESGIEVTAFRVEHAVNAKTIGFLAKYGETTVLIAMDFASLSGLKKYFTQADILFVDGSTLHQDLATHISINRQLAYYRENLRPNETRAFPRVIFTHIGHDTLPHSELDAYVKRGYPEAEVAYDGMKIRLRS
jgi:ribonuclease BN (tRNA processing enzyme)